MIVCFCCFVEDQHHGPSDGDDGEVRSESRGGRRTQSAGTSRGEAEDRPTPLPSSATVSSTIHVKNVFRVFLSLFDSVRILGGLTNSSVFRPSLKGNGLSISEGCNFINDL